MSTFTTKYVKPSSLSVDDFIQVHVHRDGAVAQVHWYELENQAHIQFESGLTLNVKAKAGVFKITSDNDVHERDLSSHPSYVSSYKDTLFRVWTRTQITRLGATTEEIEFVKDVLMELNELN